MDMEGTSSDAPRPPRRRWLLSLVVALGLTLGVVLAVNLLSENDPVAVPPERSVFVTGGSTSVRTFGCVSTATDPDGGKTCERRAADYARRKELTPQQREEVARAAQGIQNLLPRVPQREPTCPTPGGPCHIEFGPIDATYVATAWSAVFRAGYRDAVVRLAHLDDPAPKGSMVYGIPVGAGCVVGYVDTGGGSYYEAGLLPEGGCLAP